MKLAAALKERADLKTAIAELGERLEMNSRVQEGCTTAENPMVLLAQLDSSIKAYESLVCHINLTNASVEVDGKNLNQLLAKRDAISMKLRIMKTFLRESSRLTDRYSQREVAVHNAVDIAEIRKSVDRLSKELRETDNTIQEINWTVDLL